MKANELRIGNYLNASVAFNTDTLTYFENSQVQEIGSVYVKLQSRLIPYEYVSPIPLTEEWLVKFGFERILKDNGLYEYSNGIIEIPLDKWGLSLYDGNPEFDEIKTFTPPLKHVHQLQNLYFALTGEELTIKEKVI